jgi:hypothetical protein
VIGDRRFEDRVALRARLAYEDLPSKQASYAFSNGSTVTNSNQGHGWMGTALLGLAIRVRGRLWLEGGGGAGYLESGVPASVTDPATGQVFLVRAASGWGAVWHTGARYEFQPSTRDRIAIEPFFEQMNRGGTPVSLWAVRVGYRAR